ncbi:nucleic-acid-binding protein from transposon X-element [Trichonephila clavipes]|nr:nucleic-acid-binding protein from transposon X-element [Trichonephila clavipes]
MLRITDNYHVQVDTIKRIYPPLRLKTTGEYIKLYSNTTERNRIVRQTLKALGYHFCVITPKNERPIKIVIKGYPQNANPDDIKKDLENEGFEPERVTQLIGCRTKQKLPIFQCFSCNNFHHNADNCYLKPRCLKCGEEHVTKDCPIKQRLETKFCINCQVYGHMANWYGCPCFPKPSRAPLKNDRPTSSENYRAFGGTLILIKNSIKHYSLPTPSMQAIEATTVILTPIDHDPILIVSVYIPPKSDEYTFTIDIENLIQTSSNCVLFGDFNAPHTAWNCNTNSSRGVRLFDFVIWLI